MSDQQNILTIGPTRFLPDSTTRYKHRSVTILYDEHHDSCKVKIDSDKFKKEIPVQGGVSPDQLIIIADTLSAILEEFGQKELAKEILEAFSRFMISKPRLEEKVKSKVIKYIR